MSWLRVTTGVITTLVQSVIHKDIGASHKFSTALVHTACLATTIMISTYAQAHHLQYIQDVLEVNGEHPVSGWKQLANIDRIESDRSTEILSPYRDNRLS